MNMTLITPQLVRIFVSSPGDVAPERMRTRRIIDRIQGEFAGRLRLEAIFWEDGFYAATDDFQAQIADSAGVHLVVGILWGRIGTPLGPNAPTRVDGTHYESGTVFEIEAALDRRSATGSFPEVFLFRKTQRVLAAFDDPERAASEAQYLRLREVWTRWTRSGESFTRGYQDFAETNEFEIQFERFLRSWLRRHGFVEAVTWDASRQGSPYPGLAAFDRVAATVFFGRELSVARCLDRLTAAATRQAPFLLILGASGSGKSSLARAGLLPQLMTAGRVADVDGWRCAVLRPGTAPLEALVAALTRPEALGTELAAGDFAAPGMLMQQVTSAGTAELAAAPLRQAMLRAAEAERVRLGRPAALRLVLLIDQLEELLGAPADAVACFCALVEELVHDGVWVVATLRSDLYGGLAEDAALQPLLRLKDTGATFDLAPPGREAIEEIVRGPAEAAGLAFERDAATGHDLAELLVADATAAGPDALPLLQMALRELYERRAVPGGLLTFAAYREIGGLEGAIATRADAALQEASDRAALAPLLRALAADLDETGEARGRAAVEADLLGVPGMADLIAVLKQHRLLVTDADGQVRVTHEALLRRWGTALGVLDGERELIRLRARLTESAREWKAAHGSAEAEALLVLPAPLLAAAAETLARVGPEGLGEPVGAFAAAALDAAAAQTRGRERETRRRLRIARAVAASFAMLGIGAAAAGVYAWRQQAAAVTALARARDEQRASIDAGDRFVTDAANRLRQTAGVPVSIVTDMLTKGEVFFTDMASRAGTSLEVERSVARMQVSFARTSFPLGGFDAPLARARQAMRRLEPLQRAGLMRADDWTTIAEALELETEVLLERQALFAEGLTSAEAAYDNRRRAAEAGLVRGAAELGLARADRLVALSLGLQGQTDAAATRAEACLARVRDGAAADAPPDLARAFVICAWAAGFHHANAKRGAQADRLYVEALKVLDHLLAAAPTDSELLRLNYVLLNNRGAVLASDAPIEAAAWYARAEQAARRRVMLTPDDIAAKGDLAFVLHNLGTSVPMPARIEQGIASLLEAYELRHDLTQAQPERAAWWTDAAASLSILVERINTHRSDHPRRAELNRAYVAIAERLTARADAPAWRHPDLISARANLASALRQPGEAAEAFALTERVITEAEPFRADDGADRTYRLQLSYAVQNLNGIAKRAPPGERLGLLRRAEEIQSRYSAADPRHWMWRIILADTRLELARALTNAGQRTEAARFAHLAAGSGLPAPASQMAEWMRTGSGPFLADAAEAGRWAERAGRAPRDGMSRFTVSNVRLRGLEGVHQWHVYIADTAAGMDPWDDEVYRLARYDGVTLPEDVTSSFRRLLEIARVNNVSYRDLTVYAVGGAGEHERIAGVLGDKLMQGRPAEALTVLRDAKNWLKEALASLAERPEFDRYRRERLADVPAGRAEKRPVILMAELGRWLVALRQDELAAAVLDAVLASPHLDLEMRAPNLMLRAVAAERMGKPETALSMLLEVLALRPGEPEASARLGLVWADQGGVALRGARRLLDRAVQADGASVLAQAGLGWAQVQNGEVPGGLERLEWAAGRSSGDPRVTAYLGEAYRRAGRVEDATRSFRLALAQSPDPARRTWIDAQLRLAEGGRR